MMMVMISHTREGIRSTSHLTLVCCQNEEDEPVDNLEGKEYFIERMKQRSKNVLMQRAIAAKIW